MSTACSEEQLKREEMNRKQHDYRARKRLKKRTRNGKRGIRGSVSTVLAERLKQVHFQMYGINQVHDLRYSCVV